MNQAGSVPHSELGDDEYEYQYDDHETEIFLVDLDLTALASFNESQGKKKAGPKQKAVGNLTTQKSSTIVAAGLKHRNANTATSSLQPQTWQTNPSASSDTGKETPSGPTVQILDLDSENPIVMFEGRTFSCSWADMIGTNMFFKQRDDEQQGFWTAPSVDGALIGTSRIKLVGQGARLELKPGTAQKRTLPEDDNESSDEKEGAAIDKTSFPGFTSANWRTNIERRKQANFLERLIQAKKARGETDTVTTLGDRKSDTAYHFKTANLSDELKLRINNLTDRVVKGDARAVTSLKELYSQLDGGTETPDLTQSETITDSTPQPIEDVLQPNDPG